MWLLLLLLSVKSTRSEFMDQQLLIWLNWEIKQTPDDHQHHHRAHKSTVIVVLCVVQDGKSWWGCLVLIYAGFNLFISYCRWHWGVGEGCGGRSSSIKPPIHPSIDRSPIRWWSITWDYKPNTSCIIFTTGWGPVSSVQSTQTSDVSQTQCPVGTTNKNISFMERIR